MSIHADPTFVRYELAHRYERAGADASHLYAGSSTDPYGVPAGWGARVRGITSAFLARRHARRAEQVAPPRLVAGRAGAARHA